MTFNVRYFGQTLKGAGSTRRSIREICSAIAQLEELPDVICFQEIETRSLRSFFSHKRGEPEETQFEALMQTLVSSFVEAGKFAQYEGLYFPAHTYAVGKTNLFTMGLGIVVSRRFVIEAHNSQYPQDVTHRRISALAKLKQSRICAHVRIRDENGVSYDLFNTHLSLPAFATKAFWTKYPGVGFGENQKREISQVADFINSQKISDRFVLVGDFNAIPGTPAYDLLFERLRLTDPFCTELALSPADLGSSWPTAGFMNLRMRLDHIFMGEGLVCVDLADCHPFTTSGRWTGLSDHVPLLGRFSVL